MIPRLATLLAACAAIAAAQAPTTTWRPVIRGRTHMVAAGHYASAMAGYRMLEQGGNAIDAAVAATFVASVVEPHRAGIGGHLMIMVYSAKTGKVTCIDGSGWSGRRATLEYFSKVGQLPLTGPLAPVVPGAVDALLVAQEKFGKLPRARLLDPAIELAYDGFAVSDALGANLQSSAGSLRKYPSNRAVWFRGDDPVKAGQIVRQPDLVTTLHLIAASGRKAFYEGPIAHRIVDFLRQNGGILEADDFASYHAKVSEPLSTRYRDYQIYDGAQDSFDHITLESLNILAGFDLKAMGHNSPAYLHHVAEAMKLAFADRDAAVDDTRYPALMPQLLAMSHAERRRAQINADRALEPGTIGPLAMNPKFAETYGLTTYVAAIDSERNLVSITSSVSGGFGSHMYVDGQGGGFFLNNWTPLFQLNAASTNVIAPHRVPRTGWSPMLALKGGKPYMAFGTPGGDTIPQTQLQFLLNHLVFGMNVQQALEQPTEITSAFRAYRFPNAVGKDLALSSRIGDDVRRALTAKGHHVTTHNALGVGSVKAIAIDLDNNTLMGGAAPEADGYVIGR